MAERISDPVNRLTRATRRIARGDLDARIVARSSDELRRLVDDFNSMAGELQRQRRELERTHRIEAWAEMARQVAHDIKNPLTPIQLTAEHLRRVHADRGEPLTPVLQECVNTILTQVRLLRQIASEFSSFASSPTARPTTVAARDLFAGDRSNRTGRACRNGSTSTSTCPAPCPRSTSIGRLMTRALTNSDRERAARHARPRDAHGIVPAPARDARAVIRVADTGAGHGRRGAGPGVRALLLDQGDRHRPRTADRETKRRAERRDDRREQRARSRHDAWSSTVPATVPVTVDGS